MKRQFTYKESPQGILYLVATPIGNLSDLSTRALSVLKEVDVIAAEDTRNSGRLLAHFDIKKPLISLHEHNESEMSERVISLLMDKKNVAYISDAGSPGISDPGQRLVQKVLAADFPISYIPGPVAAITGLIPSGINSDHFLFYGFLDSRKSRRLQELEKLAGFPYTIIFYESPHRIKATIDDILSVFQHRKAVIARELTKIHEEYIYGSLDELATIDENSLKGEMVIIIEGLSEGEESIDEDTIYQALKTRIKSQMSAKDAIREVSILYKYPKNEVSRLYYQKLKKE
ncbi:MAG: 16S rRNA (cytidine(1402)-2'-O)-methyltransferase [Bacilli bacterium]|jgi:16S rRNA (cytidine1402-2'-O)-methyltransferase|nr:16S rRNA (cytidine(1402)-2'-O)-methyltransferase [Bacilli bacterium]MCH4201538.1 16S rRNA (cytidine(1402)-2'-O)-methyltransferase [Bacilli bacterium]MCH4235921.1 16S rRNA (cytidine(1402)-2'-O)-methyltransferase [Bacilli bacterium]